MVILFIAKALTMFLQICSTLDLPIPILNQPTRFKIFLTMLLGLITTWLGCGEEDNINLIHF